MTLKKITSIDQIEIVENGTVQVRSKTAIMEDDVQISAFFQRHVINPGDDYSNESDRVKAVCAAIHTKELIEAYRKS